MYPKHPVEESTEDLIIDPFSAFWRYHESIDPNGDPLDLLCRAEDGDEIALSILYQKRTVMNYLQLLENMKEEGHMGKAGFIVALRSIANWANGNIKNISEMRANNLAKRGDADAFTVDTQVGEENDEHLQNERSTENGGEQQLPLTQRGDCFASIRRAVLDVGEELRLEGWDKPHTMERYLDALAQGKRKGVPSASDIARVKADVLGVTNEEAKKLAEDAIKDDIAKLEASRETVLAEDSTYDDSMDFEEAICTLGILAQHRVQVKVVSDLVREIVRLGPLIVKNRGFQELKDKQRMFGYEAIALEKIMLAFERTQRAAIDKEILGTNRTVVVLDNKLQGSLDRVKKQIAEERAEEEERRAKLAMKQEVA